VRQVLREYPFASAGEGAVALMGGEDEGAFQWLTLNYLLGNLGGGIQARLRLRLHALACQVESWRGV